MTSSTNLAVFLAEGGAAAAAARRCGDEESFANLAVFFNADLLPAPPTVLEG